jgi:hypothetical protein
VCIGAKYKMIPLPTGFDSATGLFVSGSPIRSYASSSLFDSRGIGLK